MGPHELGAIVSQVIRQPRLPGRGHPVADLIDGTGGAPRAAPDETRVQPVRFGQKLRYERRLAVLETRDDDAVVLPIHRGLHG